MATVKTYEITPYVGSARPWAIRCLVCGLTSYHPADVANRFCSYCDAFHDDMERTAGLWQMDVSVKVRVFLAAPDAAKALQGSVQRAKALVRDQALVLGVTYDDHDLQQIPQEPG